MPIDPQDLVQGPATAAYSKIRGIRNQPEAKVLEFMQGLYRAAVDAKDDGDWSRVERHLEHWKFELTGYASANTQRLANTLSISLPGADGEDVLARCPEVAASTGAACHSGRTEPSGVLLAMGIPYDVALGTVRLSLGRWTTAAETERAASALARAGRASLAAMAGAAR